jgi:hypothetical protein
MPNLRQIEARKAEIQQAVKALQARSDDLTEQDYGSIDAWEQELSTLAETERRQKQLIQLDLAAAGRPLNGSPPSPRLEVRAFAEGPSAVPEGFDGAIWRGQDGSRVPVLEARHRLVDFLPPSESPRAYAHLSSLIGSSGKKHLPDAAWYDSLAGSNRKDRNRDPRLTWDLRGCAPG